MHEVHLQVTMKTLENTNSKPRLVFEYLRNLKNWVTKRIEMDHIVKAKQLAQFKHTRYVQK